MGSFTVRREEPCKCHPETCCCGELEWIVMEKGKFYIWTNPESKALHIAKALNLLEELNESHPQQQ